MKRIGMKRVVGAISAALVLVAFVTVHSGTDSWFSALGIVRLFGIGGIAIAVTSVGDGQTLRPLFRWLAAFLALAGAAAVSLLFFVAVGSSRDMQSASLLLLVLLAPALFFGFCAVSGRAPRWLARSR